MVMIYNLRRQQRHDRLPEIFFRQHFLHLGYLGKVNQIHTLLLQLLAERMVHLFRLRHVGTHAAQNLLHLTRRVPAGLIIQSIRIHQALVGQRADSNHKKFIHIGKIDARKHQPLKQRDIAPHCFMQYTTVELQPAQFPVNQYLLR